MPTIRKRGTVWQASVVTKKDGKVIYREARSFPTQRLAKDWGLRLELSIKADGVPQRKITAITLGELLLKYREARDAAKPMRRQMWWELEQLASEFEGVKLSELSAEVFSSFAARRSKSGTSGTTILHNLSTVMGALNAAKPMFGLQVDGSSVSAAISTAHRIGTIHSSRSRERRPTAEELTRLDAEFKRIASHPSTIIPMSDIIRLAVELPRRREELLTMKWENYTGRQVKLINTKSPQGYRDETVPVPPKAAAIIDALPKIDALILPYKPDSVSAAFERACIRLRIEDLHLHDLRHEGISRLFAAGLAIQEVSLISGHTDWKSLKRYTHLKPEDVLEKLAKGQLNDRIQATPQAAAESQEPRPNLDGHTNGQTADPQGTPTGRRTAPRGRGAGSKKPGL